MPTNETAVVLCIRGLSHGGAERILVHEAMYLVSVGMHVEVWYQLDGVLLSELQAAQIPAWRISARKCRSRIKSLRDRFGEIVVHSHSPSVGALLRLTSSGLGGVRFLHTEHNMVTSYRWLSRGLHRFTARRVDHLVAVSNAVLECAPKARDRRVLYHLTSDDDRITACLDLPAKCGGQLQVLCVASYTTKKDHENLLAALEKLAPHLDFGLTVHLVGEDGPTRQRVVDACRRLTAAHANLLIEPDGERNDIVSLLGDADLLVLPSISEGFPLVVAEAMAGSTPVLATDVGGLRELVEDGRTGSLVPPGSSEHLAIAMFELLVDANLRQAYAVAAKNSILSRLQGQWAREYHRLIMGDSRRPEHADTSAIRFDTSARGEESAQCSAGS